MNKYNVLALITVASASLMYGGGAAAATLGLEASVTDTCVIGNGNITGITYDPTTAAAVDFSGTFNVTCTASSDPKIALDAGANESSANDVTTRRLADGGGNFLMYQLYQDTGRADVWGVTAGVNTYDTVGATGAAETLNVYGRVASGQTTAPAGTYTDTVAITFSF